jgi:rRNA pseudouridine-1189 N-methylase Emg1 (Nep1/Mra1 family)
MKCSLHLLASSLNAASLADLLNRLRPKLFFRAWGVTVYEERSQVMATVVRGVIFVGTGAFPKGVAGIDHETETVGRAAVGGRHADVGRGA